MIDMSEGAMSNDENDVRQQSFQSSSVNVSQISNVLAQSKFISNLVSVLTNHLLTNTLALVRGPR